MFKLDKVTPVPEDIPVTNCECWDDEQQEIEEYNKYPQDRLIDYVPPVMPAAPANPNYPSPIPDSPYWYQVKIEHPSRLGSSICIKFLEFKMATKEEDKNAGAVLLSLVDTETGEVIEKWLPKKLCANMDLDAGTVWVWNKYNWRGVVPELAEQDEDEDTDDEEDE